MYNPNSKIIESLYNTLDYHNCGLLDKENTIKDLKNIFDLKECFSLYNTPYWHYIMNSESLKYQRIYGKFMIFTYNPEELLNQLKDICKLKLSPLIKYSTDKKSFQSKGKSKIICIYADRDYNKISNLAYYISEHNMIRKDIPFQAPYEFNKIKEKMMLSDFLL